MDTINLFPRGTSPVASSEGPFVLSIDPGADTGWALWTCTRHPRLYACGLGKPPFDGVRVVVIEKPQIYPNSPVPPNDIITLTLQAGRYLGIAEQMGIAILRTVLPKSWKGQLPKGVCAGRIISRLSSEELLVLKAAESKLPAGKRHNLIDAVGIGLYAYRGGKL